MRIIRHIETGLFDVYDCPITMGVSFHGLLKLLINTTIRSEKHIDYLSSYTYKTIQTGAEFDVFMNGLKEYIPTIQWENISGQTAPALIVEQPKWIPVTEKLPEVGQLVCACVGSHEVFRTFIYQGRFDNTITHWTPLPALPKKQKVVLIVEESIAKDLMSTYNRDKVLRPRAGEIQVAAGLLD